MAREPNHPRAEPYLWPLLTLGAILALQVALVQVAVNRLSWGLYPSVYPAVSATLLLSLVAWLVYRQLDRESL